jgi:hypothetical protein
MSRRTTVGLLAFAAIGVMAIGVLAFGIPRHEPLAAQAPDFRSALKERVAQADQALRSSDFKEKLLMIQGPNGKTTFVRNAAVSKLGDRAFLVGTYTVVPDWNSDSSFLGEREVWLPISDIHSITVFDNTAQLERRKGQPSK